MKPLEYVSRQQLIALLIVSAVLFFACLLFFKIKSLAYAKIEPYTIEVVVDANLGDTVFLSYDYGYGIRDEHIRPLTLAKPAKIDSQKKAANEPDLVQNLNSSSKSSSESANQATTQRFKLSVSAWKPVHALYFIAPKETRYSLQGLTVYKNSRSFEPTLPPEGPTLEGENWIYRLPLTDFDYQND